MEIPTIVAVCAPLLSCFQQIPQLNHTIKTKRVDDLSFESLIVGLVSAVVWLFHGYFIKDTPSMLASIFSLGVSIPLIYLYMKYVNERDASARSH